MPDSTPLREQAGRLLRALRGTATATEAAAALGAARVRVYRVERGEVSLDGLDEIGRAYGVQMRLVAVELGPAGQVDTTWDSDSFMDGTPAPGLAVVASADTPEPETAV